MTNVPSDPPIFHITHVDNLLGILREGGLWCDAERNSRQLSNRNIGHLHIKLRRRSRAVTAGAGGTLWDYVPFYFCPRSIMLYAIHRGHQDYNGGQASIVHLVSSVQTAIQSGRPWAYSDRHAELAHAEFYDDLCDLGEVRWDVMPEKYWTDVKEERQAEFLVHQFFPWQGIRGIGVMTPAMAQRTQDILATVQHRPTIKTVPAWYY